MAASSARMRLTVQVLPLAAENSHGPHQAAARAAFKERWFALPVQLEHTFEQVWNQVEERYKRNYLTAPEAASFTIKKLQDAYNCDLDLSDTVSSIFEGENDPQKRMIKVVPCFVYRDFSVPFTSNLRPVNAQKRHREIIEDPVNKRRRLEEQQHDLSDLDHTHDRPLPSTESEQSGNDSVGNSDTRTTRIREHLRRSKSGSSVVLVCNSQTGQEEFTSTVKEESPELGLPTVRSIPESDRASSFSPDYHFKKPLLPASASKRVLPSPRHDRSLTRSPRHSSKEAHDQSGSGELRREDDQHIMEDVIMDDDHAQDSLGPALSPDDGSRGPANEQSPKEPTLDVSNPAQPQATTAMRKNVYDLPSSPDFARGSAKRLKTYGRFPRTPKLIQKEIDAAIEPRSRSRSTQESESGSSKSQKRINGKAHAFQKPRLDEIVSTPEIKPASASLRVESPSRGSRMTGIIQETREEPINDPILDRTVTGEVPEGRNSGDKTPRTGGAPRTVKVTSLKKPKRLSYPMPGVSNAGKTETSKRGLKKVEKDVLNNTEGPDPFKSTSASLNKINEPIHTNARGSQIATSKDLNAKKSLEASASRPTPAKDPSQFVNPTRERSHSDATSNITAGSASTNSINMLPPHVQARLDALKQKARKARESSQTSSQVKESAKVVVQKLDDSNTREDAPGSSQSEELAGVKEQKPGESEAREGVQELPQSVESGDRTSPKVIIPKKKKTQPGPAQTQLVPEPSLPRPLKNSALKKGVPGPTTESPTDKSLRGMSETLVSRDTPNRSEVPLPVNVKHLAAHGTTIATKRNSATKVSEMFKKPAQNPPKPVDRFKPAVNTSVRDDSESAVRRSTPTRSEIPLPENVRKHSADEISSTARRMSDSSPSRRTLVKSEIPLPDNVKHLNSEGSATMTANLVESIPKVRELAPKNAGLTAASRSWGQALHPASKEGMKSKTVENSPSKVLAPGHATEEPIVLSSGGSSSSDNSDEEEEEEEEEAAEHALPINTDGKRITVAQSASESGAVEENAVTSADAESLPDADALGKTFSEDEQAFAGKNATPVTADTSEPPRSPVETPSNLGSEQLPNEKSTSQPPPWNAGSWGFGAIGQQHAATEKPDEEMASRSNSGSLARSALESNAESELESAAQSKSRSISGADSTRSSPAISRQPARFLSHSPTPESSSSEDESVASTPLPAKAVSVKETSDNEGEDDSDSSSSDSGSSSDDDNDGSESEKEDEDVKMVDADASAPPPSSPPPMPQQSRRQFPTPVATSQPTLSRTTQSLPRVSQVPFPILKNNTPSSQPDITNRSSQSQSKPASSRRPTFQKFPSIKQQLTAARSTPTSSQHSKKFDPRTLSLGKLAKAKQQGKKMVVLSDSPSTGSDESSSSSDSSSEDVGGNGGNAGCSVA